MFSGIFVGLIFILLFAIGIGSIVLYIKTVFEWNSIEIDDKGFYYDGGWTSGEFVVISKTNDEIIIKYIDNSTETISKDSYLKRKNFTWYKYGKTN